VIGFELLRPELAWLSLLAGVVLVIGLLGRVRRRRELARLVAAPRLASFLPGYSRTRARARLVFATGALALLGLSVTGPVRGYTLHEVATRGIDLVVCVDTSQSMLAQDLRPSRLERARREVQGLLDRVHGDRIALVAFSGDAREIAPLTHDRTTLAGLLGELRPEDNRLGGTNLAAALEHGLTLFDDRTGANEAICLLTDGEDLEGQGAAKAAEAAARGIRVYVVGIGTVAGGKIPVPTQGGGQAFLRDGEGNEVVTRLEGSSLRALAESTGGDYLSVENSPTPLVDLYDARISKLEGRDLEGGMRRVPHDRFQWTLGLAFLLMLVESGLREGSRLRRGGVR
jgi:Ca-activated chloride channel family protein